MSANALSDDTVRVFRHLVASIAYRSSRVLKEVPPGYPDMRIADGAMTAKELVNHVTNVLSYARGKLLGTEREAFAPADWDTERERLFAILGDIDRALAQGVTLAEPEQELRLLQGPLADALTHVGQLSALRRMAGSPVQPENFIKANIAIGRTGIEQA